MVAIKVSAFGGMIPAQDDRLLPDNNSAITQNTFLDAGSLQGLKTPRLLHTMQNPASKYAFRFPTIAPDKNHILSSFWLEFFDPDTNVLKSPVSDDTFERYYFASPSTQPQYNTKARILNGDDPYVIGIPEPVAAPGVTVVGGSGLTEARSYLYTWVSAYGEEGPPSPPTLQTGFLNGTWDITLTAPTTDDKTDRDLTKVRIYRTITNTTGGATFYLLVEQDIATLAYNDVIDDVTLSGNALLQSSDWGAPPVDLQGFVSMPNGMIVGWRSNEVWFCEPFRPHAWPSAYTTSVDADIVGLGVVGQTLVVLTAGFPYAATGINPANMAFSKIATFEPCMSRGSIISTAQGVLYASPNGIVLAAYGVVQNATAQLATKDRWLDLVRPETLRAARIGASYYAWGTTVFGSFEPTAFEPTAFEQYDYSSAYVGALINLIDPRIAWTQLQNDTSSTENVMTDIWSGEVFIVRDGAVMWLDMTNNEMPEPYLWRSKQYQLSEAHNLAALKIWFEENTYDPNFVQNPIRNTDPVQTLQADQYGLIRVYAAGTLIMTREIRTSGELMRLPSGFKKEFWQFEIEARVKVYNFQAATSVKELAGV